MRNKTKNIVSITISLLLELCVTSYHSSSASAQDLAYTNYDIGSPALTELWVNPASGSDSNNGRSPAAPFRTVTAAWNSIPQGVTLSSTGYRINLTAGDYPEAVIPNYLESRHGTAQFPIIIRSVDGAGTARLHGDLNVFDTSYLYLLDFVISPAPAGDALHFEQCDHLLIRGMEVNGGAPRGAHETIKINQSQYVYIEDSVVWGSYENAIDFVAVQYGHIRRSSIHGADDWCIYLKGGSANFVVEGNEIYDCGTGGFTAGQGTGFEYMTPPWIHYEAYDLKVINNIIHDTDGAGLGVNGGYNILLAYNTLYRVGSRSHTIEVVFGLRSCDGEAAACAANLALGGWGTSAPGTEEPIGNRNVSIYNNIIYNPAGFHSGDQHLAVYGPAAPSPGSHIPSPARTDTNLSIRGNIFWNGAPGLPLGIEESSAGCRPGNPACNETQLRADNLFNSIEPQLIDPAGGNFRPVNGGTLFTVPNFSIAQFPGTDRQTTPLAPIGVLTNLITRDYTGSARAGITPPGAYSGPVRSRTPASGYLFWNGFLGMINILELVNTGDTPLAVTATIFDIRGDAVGQTTAVVAAKGQTDLIVNEIPGFAADSYGLITLDFSGNSLLGRMSFYRPATDGLPQDYDFAFSVPLKAPQTGPSSVSFNTFQPSRNAAESSDPVYNWLSVINFDPDNARTFVVNKFNGSGNLLTSTSISVPPFGRIDLDGGHLNPGPSRVGLLEIVPDQNSAPYSATLIRYGVHGAGFSFAFPLPAGPPGPAEQFVPVSTGGGAQNWIEVVNDTPIAAGGSIEINDGAGNQILTLPFALAPHAQYHIDAAAVLGAESSGSAKITSTGSGVLIAQSMFYFFGPAGGIDAMYGTSAEGVRTGSAAGSYNLYLGMSNWLKLFNMTDTPITPTLKVHTAGGIREVGYFLPARGAIDVPIHDQALFGTAPDSYGLIEMSSGGAFSQLLRIKPLSPGSSRGTSRFDFVFPTPAEPVN